MGFYYTHSAIKVKTLVRHFASFSPAAQVILMQRIHLGCLIEAKHLYF